MNSGNNEHAKKHPPATKILAGLMEKTGLGAAAG